MKRKLAKFEDFAADVLPHEIAYLMQVQQFQDADNLEILKTLEYNCVHTRTPVAFRASIDKRKYSNVKQWIQQRLDAIDVDKHLVYINEMNQKIMTDAITPAEEKTLLQAIARYQQPYFYFLKFYELTLSYRHFLLIRMRYKDHQTVSNFIEQQRTNYAKSKQGDELLHAATLDIISQYSTNATESRQWEQRLLDTFYDESLDGLNRYFAVVRLTFLYFNYREFDKLKTVYDALDGLLRQGVFYSRRILFNYYANCVLLHSKLDVLQQAEEYGHLSIKQKNTDHLHYLNNYSAILLRQGKIHEALALMKQSFSSLRHSNNFQNKVGFVAFYIKCLNLNGQPADGEKMADSFLRDNADELLRHRWHIFFGAYFQSLVMQEKYDKLLKACRKYHLVPKENEYRTRPAYLPIMQWYYLISQYVENLIDDERLVMQMVEAGRTSFANPHKAKLLTDLLCELKPHIPHLSNRIKSMLSEVIVTA
ncbi:hypothetical protein [Solirubrum puertoriconensis]|uniref:Uncharacterized protein n=1 Tax=Solirubrum puertoriconensis TaxID=1751427 RepID=A0A9X0HLN8_SOLP1|nr:hypothetical protein [Solirubrum puertoriconensis]KUG08213.1 hypothetical protein ASU33_08480 [Solirubrum puertoriconensis]